MKPESWKDLAVQILAVGTATNLATFIYYSLTSWDNFMLDVVTPVALIQIALFIVVLIIFGHGAEKEEEIREEERVDELEHRIKILETRVFTED